LARFFFVGARAHELCFFCFDAEDVARVIFDELCVLIGEFVDLARLLWLLLAEMLVVAAETIAFGAEFV
jgi:hypothetical protein